MLVLTRKVNQCIFFDYTTALEVVGIYHEKNKVAITVYQTSSPDQKKTIFLYPRQRTHLFDNVYCVLSTVSIGNIKLAIDAPKNVQILRDNAHKKHHIENKDAA